MKNLITFLEYVLLWLVNVRSACIFRVILVKNEPRKTGKWIYLCYDY